MSTPGSLALVTVREVYDDYAIVETSRLGREPVRGRLYFSDLAPRIDGRRFPPEGFFFYVMAMQDGKKDATYRYSQVSAVWDSVKRMIDPWPLGKPLLCRVKQVFPDRCLVVIEDFPVGDYFAQGILTASEARRALGALQKDQRDDGDHPAHTQATMHDLVWVDDRIRLAYAGFDDENHLLLLSLDRWLDQRDKQVLESQTAQAHEDHDSPDETHDSLDGMRREMEERFRRVAGLKAQVENILLLDNEEAWAEEQKEQAAEWDVHLDYAADADYEKAIEKLEGLLRPAPKRYQVCLIDYWENQGIEAARRVHAIAPHLPVVIVSGAVPTGEFGSHYHEPLIKGVYPKFGDDPLHPGSNYGLIGYLEIALGLRESAEEKSQPQPAASLAPAHASPANPPHAVEAVTPLQNTIAAIIHAHEELCRWVNAVFVFSVSPASGELHCIYNKGVSLRREQIESLGVGIIEQTARTGVEYWNHNQRNRGDGGFAERFHAMVPFSILGLLPIVHSRSGAHVLCLTVNGVRPDWNAEREKARHLATRLAHAILKHEETQLWAGKLATYTLGCMSSSLCHDLSHQMSALERRRNLLQNQCLGELDSGELNQLINDTDLILNRVRSTINCVRGLSDASNRPRLLKFVICNIAELMKSYAHSLGVEILVREPLPVVCVPGDEVSAVVFNAVHNAVVNGRPPGCGKGLVTIRAFKKKGERIRILVADRGTGIHESSKSAIFERGVSTRGGSGLGLAICREILTSIGGSIFISNTVRFDGSTFAIDVHPIGE